MGEAPSVRRWPGPVIMAGGAIMAALFPLYSILHGPTSVYLRGEWLGLEGQVWGGLMSAVPSLLIAAGLMGARALVVGDGRAARVGYVLVLVSLWIPGVVDLLLRAISPPFLMPIEAAGLLLLGLDRSESGALVAAARRVFVVMGGLLLVAFVAALSPQEFSDSHNGYRVFGILAYLLVGLGWLLVGATIARHAAIMRRTESLGRA